MVLIIMVKYNYCYIFVHGKIATYNKYEIARANWL